LDADTQRDAHLVMAIGAFIDHDSAATQAELLAVRRADPVYELSEDLAPAGSSLRELWTSLPSEPVVPVVPNDVVGPVVAVTPDSPARQLPVIPEPRKAPLGRIGLGCAAGSLALLGGGLATGMAYEANASASNPMDGTYAANHGLVIGGSALGAVAAGFLVGAAVTGSF
jgi:hypothetical protein